IGIEGRTHDINSLELEKSMNTCRDGTSKKINLMWTPYLERKFASALELLGEGLCLYISFVSYLTKFIV
ncbi:hypothetical protein, partial [Flavobacterium sp. SaA2.13]|uniref:hypothetical protein n=1 Tax=Flavobacterium sp. SaA2.13 TaxID=2691898 RepID=UPI001CEF623D